MPSRRIILSGAVAAAVPGAHALAQIAPDFVVEGQAEWSGANSTVLSFTTRIAIGDDEWQAMWRLTGNTPPGPLPESAMAIGIFVGQRPSGGHGVRITGFEPDDDFVIVTYEEEMPDSGLFTTQALTYPWTIRVFPRVRLPVLIERAG